MRKAPSLMPFVIVAILMSLIFSAAAEAQLNANTGTTLLNDFVSRTTGWWGTLRGYALTIFKITAALEICLFGIRMALQKAQIEEIVGQFVIMLLFLCFIAAVIMNYKDWAEGIAISGLTPVAASLSGGASADIGSPVAMIFACLEAMVPVLGDAGITDIGMVMVYVFCMGSIIAVFAFICCKYIITVCEFHIVANAGVLLIGLGGSKMFKDYAINVMRYVLSIGVKLFVLQLIFNIGFSILSLSDVTNLQGQSIENIDLFSLVGIIIQGAMLLALAQTLPNTCAGLLSGTSIDGGNPLGQMAKAAAGAGMAAVTGGASAAVTAARMAKNAHTAAGGMQGGATLGNMGKAMRNAYSDARGAKQEQSLKSNPGSMSKQLQSAANAARAAKAASGGGDSGGSKGPVDMTKGPQSK